MKDLRNINFRERSPRDTGKKRMVDRGSYEKSELSHNHAGVLEWSEKSLTLRTIDDLARALGCRHWELFNYF